LSKIGGWQFTDIFWTGAFGPADVAVGAPRAYRLKPVVVSAIVGKWKTI
jgi:hypothetical protein